MEMPNRFVTCFVLQECRDCVTKQDMNETLTVRLAKGLAQALEEEAHQTGLSKGEITRQALEARLHRASGLSVMRRYFGSVSGPVDLSTNKAYRRNWKKRQG